VKRVWQSRHEAPWRDDPWDDPDVVDALVLERPRRHHGWMRYVVYLAAIAVCTAIILRGLHGMWYLRQVNPEGDPSERINFTVEPADTLDTLTGRLFAQGFIVNEEVFRDYVGDHGGLEVVPGYYELRTSDHMGNVLAALRTPPALTFSRVTFPEGFSMQRMAQRLNEVIPRFSEEEFLQAATDGLVTSDLLPPGVTSLEGLLFPDTYEVSNAESARQVIQRMVSLMERVGRQEELEEGAAQLFLTPYQVLIVASLIEREAKVDADRPLIARVIYNRLFTGQLLQIDASLYYGQDASLPFSQLRQIDTPYNLYMYQGLPPTPIANPGRASIEAALNPAPNPGIGDPVCDPIPDGELCQYLYYVVIDESGRHAFAATLQQHEANILRARELGVL
jgi:UPF0755 protein